MNLIKRINRLASGTSVLRAVSAAAVFAVGLSTTPLAQAERGWGDWARVTHVQPIIVTERVNHPRQECWTRPHRGRGDHRRRGDAVPALIGGSLGGLIGHRLADGNGRKAATIAGAALGAGLAHSIAAQRRVERGYGTQHERHCQTVDDYQQVERVDGYRVTYRYHGQRFTRRMDYDPGRRVRVRVRVDTPRHPRRGGRHDNDRHGNNNQDGYGYTDSWDRRGKRHGHWRRRV